MKKIKPIIENRYGKPITFSSECIDVSKHIFNTTGLTLSAQTLRRMLGFIDSKVMPSKNSLEILDELDWCLSQLENMQSHKTISEIASSKVEILKQFF